MPCIKINKILVDIHLVRLYNEVHNNVGYIVHNDTILTFSLLECGIKLIFMSFDKQNLTFMLVYY